MSGTGLLIWAGSVCQCDFYPSITAAKPSWDGLVWFAKILGCVLNATENKFVITLQPNWVLANWDFSHNCIHQASPAYVIGPLQENTFREHSFFVYICNI